eukprot:5918016-Alexandrium_andersonii.AAC.1
MSATTTMLKQRSTNQIPLACMFVNSPGARKTHRWSAHTHHEHVADSGWLSLVSVGSTLV